MVGDIELVLGKVGRKDEHFIAGIEERLQDHIACARGADRHEDVFGGKVQAGLAAQLVGDGLADLGVARIRHIAVRAGRVAGHHAAQRIQHRGRRLHVRIAERKIEDRIGPALALQPHALLEHAPNPGGVLELPGDGLGNGHNARLLFLQEFFAGQQADACRLQTRDCRVRIGEAKDEDCLVAANIGEGVHVLDIDSGAVQRA